MHRLRIVAKAKEGFGVSKKPQAQLRSMPGTGDKPTKAGVPRKRRHKQIQARVTKPDADVIVVYFPLEIGRKIRMLAASSRMNMTEIVTEAMIQFFDAGGKLPPQL